VTKDESTSYTLTGKLVTLRIPIRDDYDKIQDIFNDKESMRALIPFFGRDSWTKDEITERFITLEKEFHSGSSIDYAVVDNTNGEIIGNCAIKNIDPDNKSAEFGIILHRKSWGKGVSSECHVLALDYAFHHLKVDFIGFITDEHNLRMQGFFKKHGIRFQGTNRDGDFNYVVESSEWPHIREKLI